MALSVRKATTQGESSLFLPDVQGFRLGYGFYVF